MGCHILPAGPSLYLRAHAGQHKCCLGAQASPFAGHRRCRLPSGTACFARNSSVKRRREVQLRPASYQVYIAAALRIQLFDCLFTKKVPLNTCCLPCSHRQKHLHKSGKMLLLSSIRWRVHMQACQTCTARSLSDYTAHWHASNLSCCNLQVA